MTKHAVFPGWRVVAGSGIGIAFGSIPLFASGFGLLAASMAREFGWHQPEVAKAATLFLLCETIAYPLCGWPLDRWGSRKFAVGSILAFTVGLIALSQISGSLIQFWLAFAFIGLITAGTNVVSYARAISLWFNRKRGIALGIAASAQALGSFLIPVFAQKGIAAYGWSGALLILAGFECIVCAPLVGYLVRDSPAKEGLLPDGDTSAAVATEIPADPLMSVREVLGTLAFWKLALAFSVMGMTFYSIAPNIVYILNGSDGLSLADVAKIQAISGIATLFGRIGFGYLLDRIHGPWVAVLTLICSAGSALTYANTTEFTLLASAAVVGGMAIGGESDLMPYLASRYFGTRSVSRVFGLFLFTFFIGATIGPVTFAAVSAHYHGAATPLVMLAGLQLLPALLFVSMGRYKQ